jgi:hypothetical protein
MVNRELLKGQKLLGWVLILIGLLLLVLIGLARSLAARYSLPALGTFAAGNPGMGGIVAWLLLAAGYVFVLSAFLEERLRDLAGEFEERVSHLTRELAAFQQRMGDRCGAGDPAGNQAAHRGPPPGAGPAQPVGEKTVGAAAGMATANAPSLGLVNDGTAAVPLDSQGGGDELRPGEAPREPDQVGGNDEDEQNSVGIAATVMR